MPQLHFPGGGTELEQLDPPGIGQIGGGQQPELLVAFQKYPITRREPTPNAMYLLLPPDFFAIDAILSLDDMVDAQL